jgi:hypothetical protein
VRPSAEAGEEARLLSRRGVPGQESSGKRRGHCWGRGTPRQGLSAVLRGRGSAQRFGTGVIGEEALQGRVCRGRGRRPDGEVELERQSAPMGVRAGGDGGCGGH